MGSQSNYSRTISADDSGFQYERKLTALFVLRLYSSTDDFIVASNYSKGDKFDDLVFAGNRKGDWTTCFVQLKHKQAQLLTKKKVSLGALQSGSKGKNDFHLSKYFESFKSVARNFFSNKENDGIFSNSFSTSQFFIYTNALLHDEVMQRNRTRVDIDFLSTNSKSEVNIRFDPDKDIDLFPNCRSDTFLCGEFMKKLVFCSGQASEHELDALIEEEVKKVLNLSTVDGKYVISQLFSHLNQWQRSGKYVRKNDITSLLMHSSAEIQAGKKDESLITFVPSFLKSYASKFTPGSLFVLTNKSDNTLMCMAALKQIGFLNEPNQCYSIKKLEMASVKEHLMISTGINVLVVDCDTDCLGVNLKDVFLFINTLHTFKTELIILLVTINENSVILKHAGDMGMKKQAFNCNLVNITEESKAYLMERNLNFQGYETPLYSLLSGTKVLDDVFDMVAMTELLRGRTFNVGMKPIERITYYVTRVLMRNFITSTAFTSTGDDIKFAISGLSLEEAKTCIPLAHDTIVSATPKALDNIKSIKVFIMDQGVPAQLFRTLCAVIPDIHWLELKDRKKKQWRWKNSSRNISLLFRHIDRKVSDYFPTDNIMAIEDKIVIVAAEPGMGKSTLLVHLASETKRICPHIWVIPVCLNDFADHFSEPSFLSNPESSVKKLLTAAADVSKDSSKFAARLFDYCYNVSGNMVILLDGFDEIAHGFLREGLAMLRVLKESRVARIWVTTRPIMRRPLQTELVAMSFSIRPFGESDQKNFLVKYWKDKVPELNITTLNMFVDKVLELIRTSFDDDINVFTGIPLQTRMIAEVFDTEIQNFNQTQTLQLPAAISGLQLFQAFVTKKLEIMINDKSKITATTAQAKKFRDQLLENHELFLTQLAELTIFSTEECSKLSPSIKKSDIEDLKRRVADGEETAGIVLSYKSDAPHFIHRTFAEYLVAKFLAKHYKANREFLSSETFLSSSFNLVRYFFDRIVAQNMPLHEAILNKDKVALVEALQSTTNVDCMDYGGRTALHLAAYVPGSDEMIRALIKAGATVTLRDSIMNLLPIEYAIRSKSMLNVAPLIDSKRFSQLPIGAIPITCESVKIAVAGDYESMLLYLLEHGVTSVIGIDVLPQYEWLESIPCEGFTLLHLAAAYNAGSILNYLLRKDIRDSKVWLLERKEKVGRTALALASMRGSNEAVKILLNAGAALPAINGTDIAQMAVESHNDDLFKLLIQTCKSRGVPPNWFAGALTALIADRSEWGVCGLFALVSVIPEVLMLRTKKNAPLLAAASIRGNDGAVNILCRKKVDVNEVYNERTALHYAATGGHERVIKILLKVPNVNIEARDGEGYTPIYLAVAAGNWNVFELLVKQGATIHCVAKDGSNLSHAVAKSLDRQILDFLLSNDVNFVSMDMRGQTSLGLFEQAGASDIVERLKMLYQSPSMHAPKPLSSDDTNEAIRRALDAEKKLHDQPRKKKKVPNKRNEEQTAINNALEQFFEQIVGKTETADDTIQKLRAFMNMKISSGEPSDTAAVSNSKVDKQKRRREAKAAKKLFGVEGQKNLKQQQQQKKVSVPGTHQQDHPKREKPPQDGKQSVQHPHQPCNNSGFAFANSYNPIESNTPYPSPSQSHGPKKKGPKIPTTNEGSKPTGKNGGPKPPKLEGNKKLPKPYEGPKSSKSNDQTNVSNHHEGHKTTKPFEGSKLKPPKQNEGTKQPFVKQSGDPGTNFGLPRIPPLIPNPKQTMPFYLTNATGQVVENKPGKKKKANKPPNQPNQLK